MDDFDRAWVDGVAQVKWLEAAYALIGLTRLGERPTTVRQLAAALAVPEPEAVKLAWRASRVRPQDGQFRLDTPWPGASPRRRLVIGDRELSVSGCAPDVFAVAAVLDVPFRLDDTCPTTGTPIRVWFAPRGVEHPEPPEAVVVLLAPGQLGQLAEMTRRETARGHGDDTSDDTIHGRRSSRWRGCLGGRPLLPELRCHHRPDTPIIDILDHNTHPLTTRPWG